MRLNGDLIDPFCFNPLTGSASMLRDVKLAEFDGSTRLFGRNYSSPIVISPIGVQAQLDPVEADCATAKAASDLEIPFTLSSATSRPMEKVFEHAGFSRSETEDDHDGNDAWFQLYWPQDDELTESLVAEPGRQATESSW